MKSGYLFLLLITLASCATVTPLTGGDKDVTPPRVLKSFPDSAQLNVSTNQIRLIFDEYFTVNNLNKELLVSPPFSKPITHQIKNKSLILKLPESLQPNTTYQFHFGNAIKDVNEGNTLSNYSLVFSSGNQLDSSEIAGNVKDAKALTNLTGATVYLYKRSDDTSIYHSRPYYITKTDSAGNFVFKHIKDTSYALYAFEDVNNNSIPDEGEKFAFLSERVSATEKVSLKASPEPERNNYTITRVKDEQNGSYIIEFGRSIPKEKHISVRCNPNDYGFSKEGYLPIKKVEKNKLKVFISEDLDKLHPDSLQFSVVIQDTILLEDNCAYTSPGIFEVVTQINEQAIIPQTPFSFTSNKPITSFKSGGISMYSYSDSTRVKIDTLYKLDFFTIEIKAQTQAGKNYQLTIDTSTLRSAFGKDTKSDSLEFHVLNRSDLGSVEIKINVMDTSASSNFIFELYQEILQKEIIAKKCYIRTDTTLAINSLKAGKYFVRVYDDANRDEQWTPGDFLKNRQPEPIFILNKAIDVRSNWETKDISLIIN